MKVVSKSVKYDKINKILIFTEGASMMFGHSLHPQDEVKPHRARLTKILARPNATHGYCIAGKFHGAYICNFEKLVTFVQKKLFAGLIFVLGIGIGGWSNHACVHVR